MSPRKPVDFSPTIIQKLQSQQLVLEREFEQTANVCVVVSSCGHYLSVDVPQQLPSFRPVHTMKSVIIQIRSGNCRPYRSTTVLFLPRCGRLKKADNYILKLTYTVHTWIYNTHHSQAYSWKGLAEKL